MCSNVMVQHCLRPSTGFSRTLFSNRLRMSPMIPKNQKIICTMMSYLSCFTSVWRFSLINYFEFEVGLIHSGLRGSVEKKNPNTADPKLSDLGFINIENIFVHNQGKQDVDVT